MNPAALTITANGASKTYGAAVPTLAYTESGLVNGDTPRHLLQHTGHCGDGGLKRRQLRHHPGHALRGLRIMPSAFTNGTLTVNPAMLSISANDKSKVYGTALPGLRQPPSWDSSTAIPPVSSPA